MLGFIDGKYISRGSNIVDIELTLEIEMVFKPSGLYLVDGSGNRSAPQLFFLHKKEYQVSTRVLGFF